MTAGLDGFCGSRPYQLVGIGIPLRRSGFSRSVGSTDYAICVFHSRKLAARGMLSWLCCDCCVSVEVRSAHDGPSHASRFVRQRDGHDKRLPMGRPWAQCHAVGSAGARSTRNPAQRPRQHRDEWEALCRDRNSYAFIVPLELSAGIELVSCCELLATSKMLLHRRAARARQGKARGCRIR